MAKKKDPSITFLNKFGYNVIKLPRVGIEPMDVIGSDTTTQWLGPLRHKTIYVRDGDLGLWDLAQAQLGQSMSALFIEFLPERVKPMNAY